MIREGGGRHKLLTQVFYNSGTMVDNQLLKKKEMHIQNTSTSVGF